MDKRKVYLVCNAHIDPVWLWRRSEGMAEAISTFRVAADFCERYDGFVFNHNESVLYEWVLENEPELFERIRKLVKQGKWNIMGGWYLQPDVIMPCGESVIRQIETGNRFFEKHFGKRPKTAMNFDSFGHSRGLVQILKKCGYDSYVYMRPREMEYGPTMWHGFDGSEVVAFRLYAWYDTARGYALSQIQKFLDEFKELPVGMVTWGIGDHGGGPSEHDLNEINSFANENTKVELIHSDIEAYFKELDKTKLELVDKSLMHCMIGCYTSMVRVKQGHRMLENKLAMCEKMLWQSEIDYDKAELEKVEKSLLFIEFHDILPGTMIKKAEEDSLRLIGYGGEIADMLMSRAFFKLCSGQAKAENGEIPIFVYNPHPYPIKTDFEVEFQLAGQNYNDDEAAIVKVRNENGQIVPCQNEKEDCTMNWDWRKKVVFHTEVKPMGITRFDCELYVTKPYVPVLPYEEIDTHIIVNGERLCVRINKETGFVDKYSVDGKEKINPEGIKILAYKDDEDPWGMNVDGFHEVLGEFRLLSKKDANIFRGYPDEDRGNLAVIENGEVRTKIQGIYGYKNSFAVITYIISKHNVDFDIEIKMFTADVNTAFKLCFDTTVKPSAKAIVQTMFGAESARKDGMEIAFQKWCALDDGETAFCVINDGSHGGSADKNRLSITLLRTAVYSAHPNELGRPTAPCDRVLEHIDMGEREFRFKLCSDMEKADYKAEVFNQKPFVMSFFPSGAGERYERSIEIDNKNIILSAVKKCDSGTLIRVYNSCNSQQCCTLKKENNTFDIRFKPFEVKTFIESGKSIRETDMLGGVLNE